MEPAERTVFRRKRPLIVKLLSFSIPMQKTFRDYGLLRDEMLQEIMFEQTDKGQLRKFLEILTKGDKVSESFEAMQALLRDEDHGWVTEEMAIDLLAERGELDIEDYVEKESQMIVHKIFGQSKRISETDKAEMSYVLALRYQAAKEAVRAQLDRMVAERDQAISHKNEEVSKLKALSEKIWSFWNIHKLDDVSLGQWSDNRSVKMKEPISKLEEAVDRTLEILARIHLENETFSYERKKCLEVLKLQKLPASLDIAVDTALRAAADDVRKSRREVDITDQVAQDLNTRLRNTQVVSNSEMAAKDRQIHYLEGQVKTHSSRCADLEAEVKLLREQLAEAQKTIGSTRKRVDALSKTRRLGYYQPGWAEKSIETNGLDASGYEERALVPMDQNKDKPKGITKGAAAKPQRDKVTRATLVHSSSWSGDVTQSGNGNSAKSSSKGASKSGNKTRK